MTPFAQWVAALASPAVPDQALDFRGAFLAVVLKTSSRTSLAASEAATLLVALLGLSPVPI
jgi:hypothetical protein